MKNSIFILAILGLLFISAGLAQGSWFNINLNLGKPSDQIVLDEPPVFISPLTLGFYVAVEIPYDMFLIDMNYYLYRRGTWHIARGYNGPWVVIQYQKLPRGLQNHKYKEIIKYRNEEYKIYKRDKDNYHGRHYRPAKHKAQKENKK